MVRNVLTNGERTVVMVVRGVKITEMILGGMGPRHIEGSAEFMALNYSIDETRDGGDTFMMTNAPSIEEGLIDIVCDDCKKRMTALLRLVGDGQ